MILNRSEGFGVGPTVNPHTKVSEVTSRDFGFGEDPSLGSQAKENQFKF